MMLIKARFLKQDKPSRRAYTYRTKDDVKPGDIVTDAKGSKLVVMDDPVDMGWVETYGEEKIALVAKYVDPEKEESED